MVGTTSSDWIRQKEKRVYTKKRERKESWKLSCGNKSRGWAENKRTYVIVWVRKASNLGKPKVSLKLWRSFRKNKSWNWGWKPIRLSWCILTIWGEKHGIV